MSEYTPTTENIRQTFAYIQAGLDDDDGYPFVMQVHVETFDRWLAEVERAAAEKAWQEGAEAAFYDPYIRGFIDYPENPYRAEAYRREGKNDAALSATDDT